MKYEFTIEWREEKVDTYKRSGLSIRKCELRADETIEDMWSRINAMYKQKNSGKYKFSILRVTVSAVDENLEVL